MTPTPPPGSTQPSARMGRGRNRDGRPRRQDSIPRNNTTQRKMEKLINHISHEHPLQLSICQQTDMASSCSRCELTLSGSIYTCTLCNYSLHVSCSQALRLIYHPADPKHPLSLLTCRDYPDQSNIICDACGHQVTDFSYRCSTCNLDFHILCVSMPLSLCHDAHDHPLQLAFFPPYMSKSFRCNICSNIGSKEWVYRCAMCSFDAHTRCVGHGHGERMMQSLEGFSAGEDVKHSLCD